jgi:hypothetical protein
MNDQFTTIRSLQLVHTQKTEIELASRAKPS